MKTYIVQYRVNGGRLERFDEVRATGPAKAIIQAAQSLTDMDGDLEILATEQ